jgi:nickel superoxide dismutase
MEEKMKQAVKMTTCLIVLIFVSVSLAAAHCEIPCGIYDDPARIQLIREHITTIERSMDQIDALHKHLKKGSSQHYSQFVRWVNNKEDHADKLQHIVSQYFMTQRISPDDENYPEKISVLHQMLIEAMKCKQTVDAVHVKNLRDLADRFEKLYLK